MVEKILHFFERFPLDLLSHLSSTFPIIVGAYRFKELNISEKLIGLLFIFNFIKDTYVLVYIFTVSSPNTFFIENIEQIIVTLLVGSIYYYSFDKNFQKKLILLFSILCGLITFFAYNKMSVSIISLATSRIFSITLALLFFNKILKDMRVKIITRHSLFWFTSALLLYSAGTFFIMLFSEYWHKDANEVSASTFDFYWNSSQILFIVFCILSAYGLWVSKYKSENYL